MLNNGPCNCISLAFPVLVNGNWSPWNVWGDCTTTCGGGQRKRFRTCTNPPPTHGGRACVGPSEGVQTCNVQPCPSKYN